MVYRRDDDSIITGFQKEACEFAYNYIRAKLDVQHIRPYVDDYEAAVELWYDRDTGASGWDGFAWQDVLNYPEQNVERAHGSEWSCLQTWDEIPGDGVHQVSCIMADSTVYYSVDGIVWNYVFTLENGEAVYCSDVPETLVRCLLSTDEMGATYTAFDFFVRDRRAFKETKKGPLHAAPSYPSNIPS